MTPPHLYLFTLRIFLTKWQCRQLKCVILLTIFILNLVLMHREPCKPCECKLFLYALCSPTINSKILISFSYSVKVTVHVSPDKHYNFSDMGKLYWFTCHWVLSNVVQFARQMKNQHCTCSNAGSKIQIEYFQISVLF